MRLIPAAKALCASASVLCSVLHCGPSSADESTRIQRPVNGLVGQGNFSLPGPDALEQTQVPVTNSPNASAGSNANQSTTSSADDRNGASVSPVPAGQAPKLSGHAVTSATSQQQSQTG